MVKDHMQPSFGCAIARSRHTESQLESQGIARLDSKANAAGSVDAAAGPFQQHAQCRQVVPGET